MEQIEILAKQFFNRYYSNRQNVQRLHERLFLIEDKMRNVRFPKISDEPRGGTPLSMEELIVKKSELEERIQNLQNEGAQIRHELTRVIDHLQNVQQAEILELRFIDCLDFDTIAEKTGYTLRHVLRLYTGALKSASDVINVSQK